MSASSCHACSWHDSTLRMPLRSMSGIQDFPGLVVHQPFAVGCVAGRIGEFIATRHSEGCHSVNFSFGPSPALCSCPSPVHVCMNVCKRVWQSLRPQTD